jgi:signal transduction histidine kinase
MSAFPTIKMRASTGEMAVKLASRLRFLINPISLFVGLQTLSVTTIVLWVVWFSEQEDRLKQLLGTRQWSTLDGGTTVAILVIGCILLGGILVLAAVWFFAGLRQSAMIRQQRNFLSSVTHEVRSPLASIQLALETLGHRNLDPAIRDRLISGAHQDIARMTRLVDQILIASRLDRGITLFAEAPETIDLSTWLESVAREAIPGTPPDPQIAESTAAPSRIEVKVKEGVQLRAPAQALRVIVDNLIHNAIKYSPADSKIILRGESQDGKIRISVEDHGMGIDSQEMKQLFKIFRRGERAMTKAIPGTGLGLYIVDSMTRIMGGRVRVESPGLNRGATFTVELPAPAIGGHR